MNLDEYIIETYLFEATIDPREAAEHLCHEQSTAMWSRIGVDEDLRVKHGAKLLDLKVIKRKDAPIQHENTKTRKHENTVSWCEVKVAHPHINFGPRIPNILTAAAGEGAFYSPGITFIKLTDLEFPKKFLDSFTGPKFGIAGLRRLMNIDGRPFFFGVVKPNIGLAPEDFADLAYEAWMGGLDIAKDDELLSDIPWSPLKRRVRLCAEKAKRAEDATGEKKIFLANITDEVDRLIPLHDTAVESGAGMVMVNVMTVGLSAVRMLCKHASIPVVAHFDFIAPFTRLPFHGLSSELITKLERMAGCDVITMPGFGERMRTPDKEVMDNVKMCTCELGSLKKPLPAPGGSDNAETLPLVYEKLHSIDFGFAAGRGIFGHPKGPKEGARSIRLAWDAIEKLSFPRKRESRERTGSPPPRG